MTCSHAFERVLLVLNARRNYASAGSLKTSRNFEKRRNALILETKLEILKYRNANLQRPVENLNPVRKRIVKDAYGQMPTVPAVTSLSVNLRLSVPCVANGHTLSHLPQTFSRYPSLRLSQFFTQCTVGLHRRRHIGAKRMKEYPQRRCSSPQQTFGTRSACGYIAMQ